MKHILTLTLIILTTCKLIQAEEPDALTASRFFTQPQNVTIISAGSFDTNTNGTVVISSPGNYLLSETIQPASTSRNILINSSDVILNLDGHTIIGTGGTTSKGIEVAANLHNVVIRNGQVRAPIQEGVHINAGCSNIIIDTITVTALTNSPGFRIDSSDVTLTNVGVYGDGAKTKGIHLAAGVRHVTFDGVTVSDVGGTALYIDTAANNISIKNGYIATVARNSGIVCSNSSYDISVKNTVVTAAGNHGIQIFSNCHDIQIQESTIRNCTNAGVYIDTACSNIFLGNLYLANLDQAVQCNASGSNINVTNVIANTVGNGFSFSGTSTGIIRSSKINRCKVSNTQNASTFGVACTYCSNLVIKDSEFYSANNVTSGSGVGGISITNSNNISCINTLSNNHTGDQAYGFKLTTVQDAYFENCLSRNNTGQSATANNGAFGFYLSGCSGCIFKNCASTSHLSKVLSAGWYLIQCSGSSFTGCTAINNQPIGLTGFATALFVGFYSQRGQGNQWYNCNSSNHNAGNLASTDGYGAFGFYLTSETQSLLRQCTAYSQGNSVGHLANATGIYLDGVINSPCTYCEIDGCTTSSNCTSATSGTSAYGIRDTALKTTNLIINCFSSSNTDNANPRVTTNYAAQLPIGGTLKQNFPAVEAGMDGVLDLANKPPFYNVSMTS